MSTQMGGGQVVAGNGGLTWGTADVGLFALLYLLSIVGFRMGVVFHNQLLQIPLVLRVNDPGIFPGDPFANSLGHYASALWWGVALLARAIPLEPLLAILFLLERAFAMFAFGRLAQAFAPGRRLAVWTGWLFVAYNPQPFVADGTIVPPYFEHTGVAVAVLVLAAAALWERRPLRFALLVGLAFNCNLLYTLFALAYLCPLLLAPERRSQWRGWLLALASAFVLGAPSFWIARAAAGQGGLPFSDVLWVKALRVYFPYHFFPDSWQVRGIIRLILFLVLANGVTLWLKKSGAVAARHLWPWVPLWSLVLLGWIGASAGNAFFFPRPGLFILHMARAIDLGLVLISLAVMTGLGAELEQGAGRARWGLAFAFGAVPLLFLNGAVFALLFGGFFVALVVVAARRARRGQHRAGDDGHLALLAALGTLLVFSARSYRQHGEIVRRPDPAIREIADWARERSPRAAVFLVDVRWGEFRSLAQRQPFITWQEGAAMMWQKDFVNNWVERLGELGWDIRSTSLRFEDLEETPDPPLSPAAVRDIAKRHRLDYWVVPRDQPAAFPVVFEGRSFKVMALGAGS